MFTSRLHHEGPGPVDLTVSEEVVERDARRAWLSLLLYPLSFAAAFLVGEGLV